MRSQLEGSGTGQRQSLEVVRIDLQRALDQLFRLAGEALAVRHRKHVGEIDE
jgi:hypothetical protein